MAQTKQRSRGGRRHNSGRSNILGPTNRRDLRVPEHIEKTAIRVGRGVFSDGMRFMCEEYIHLQKRSLQDEVPPQDTPVLIYVADESRWAVAQAEDVGGQIIFREVGKPDACHVTDGWRHLPKPE